MGVAVTMAEGLGFGAGAVAVGVAVAVTGAAAPVPGVPVSRVARALTERDAADEAEALPAAVVAPEQPASASPAAIPSPATRWLTRGLTLEPRST